MERIGKLFHGGFARTKLSRRSKLPGPRYFVGNVRQAAQILGKEWQKLVLLGLFGLGLFLGAKAAAANAPDWSQSLAAMLREQHLSADEKSIFGNALSYFCTEAVFLAVAYILGLCAVGLPLVLFLPVLRGLGLGAVTGWLLQTYGWQGLGYSILLLFPAAIVSMVAMLIYCKESMLMSSDMMLVSSGKAEKVECNLRMYNTRYLALLAVCAGAAFLNALCTAAFSKLFTF